MKYFVHLAYSGKNYRGWQKQPNVPSVQGVLEHALSDLLKESVVCSCCSRTDALVHAAQFFVHIKTEKELAAEHVFIINQMLPKDIVVYDLIPVAREAHAQRDAISRTYQYFIHSERNPFLANYSSYYPLTFFDIDLVKKACKCIIGTYDFRSLCKEPDKQNSTLCDIHSLRLLTNQKRSAYCFEITSNRFLKGMVRLIVGSLLQVGKAKLTVEAFQERIDLGTPIPSKLAAYPQGLYLSSVKYEGLDVPPVWGLNSILISELNHLEYEGKGSTK